MDNHDVEQKIDLYNKLNSRNGKACDTLKNENDVRKSKGSIQTPVPEITPDNSNNFEINVYKNYKISICKPLILLKLTNFLYFGVGPFMMSFLVVIYRERGVSLSELSLMTMIAPAVQFLGNTLSGVISDKLGRAKPVFVANLLITMGIIIGIMVSPKISSTNSEMQSFNLTCHGKIEVFTTCKAINKTIDVDSCVGYCQDTLMERCTAKQIDCGNFEFSKKSNLSFIVSITDEYLPMGTDYCYFNATSTLKGNSSYSWCSDNDKEYCALSCKGHANTTIQKSSWVLVLYFVMYSAFLTTSSNCYRTLDVTSMFLAKDFGSTFGHERFFAMLGNVLISPVAGYIADLASPAGQEQNYYFVLYLYLGVNMFLLPILYKLEVRVKPPGEKMLKKSLILIQNPDVLIFFILTLILGTAWNFSKLFLFWFLKELNAKSVLVGLITSVSALYGLPFLLSAHWWVRKIGTTRVFILALLAYSVNSIGYSFLQNPWFSLALESTGIMSYYVLWIAVMEYAHDVAPEGLRATIIAVSGALHFSAGKVTSGMIGKFIMDNFGGRAAFRFGALMSLITAILYAFYIIIRSQCIKEKHKLKETEESNEKPEEIYTVTLKDIQY